jgi:hypothetical protein
MPTTIIYRERVSQVPNGVTQGDNLWLALDELEAATGWEVKPEGVCLDDVCVPLPARQEGEFLSQDGSLFNFAAFHRLLGQPVVHDEAQRVWLFGEGAASRTGALRSPVAPDFTLPDLDGHLHSLSDYRGKKVVMTAWASW